MNSQRALITISFALALLSLVGCLRKKPMATYVNQNLTLTGYVEPGQVLEWRVSSPQSPPFRFKPESGFCAAVKELAVYGSPAKCVVAPQSYRDSVQMNVYTYELEPTESTEHFRASKQKGSDGQAPPGSGSTSPSSGVFTQRVGSCGGCSVIQNPLSPGVTGSSPVGPENPQVTLICSGTQLKVQDTPQTASVGSSITWINTQDRLVKDWTIEFEKDGVCSPKPINAGHNNCTVQTGVVAGDYNYTANLYKSTDHSPTNLLCGGAAVLKVK